MKFIIKKYVKLVIFDTLAVLCFIGVVLFGWLPGPGGIPLFLLGLSMLAVNHDFAERWINTVKIRGNSLRSSLFPDKLWVKRTYDTLSLCSIVVGSIILVKNLDNRIVSAISTIGISAGLFIFLINRDRFGSFTNLLKNIKKTRK